MPAPEPPGEPEGARGEAATTNLTNRQSHFLPKYPQPLQILETLPGLAGSLGLDKDKDRRSPY